jgi:hypothetical protein
MSHEAVTADTVRGTLCIYLLLGFLWWSAYSIIDILDPAAFHFPEETEATRMATAELADEGGRPHLLYFSFVTLTTLGYGDITPVNSKALSLALLEAIIGQLFVAVTIARVVGIHSAGATNLRSRDSGESREDSLS